MPARQAFDELVKQWKNPATSGTAAGSSTRRSGTAAASAGRSRPRPPRADVHPLGPGCGPGRDPPRHRAGVHERSLTCATGSFDPKAEPPPQPPGCGQRPANSVAARRPRRHDGRLFDKPVTGASAIRDWGRWPACNDGAPRRNSGSAFHFHAWPTPANDGPGGQVHSPRLRSGIHRAPPGGDAVCTSVRFRERHGEVDPVSTGITLPRRALTGASPMRPPEPGWRRVFCASSNDRHSRRYDPPDLPARGTAGGIPRST